MSQSQAATNHSQHEGSKLEPAQVQNPLEYQLPARYHREETIVCMLHAKYSAEAKRDFEIVQEKVKEWLGDQSASEDNSNLFDMLMTLFLTPEQCLELKELVKDTNIEAVTVEDFAKAIESGVQGKLPRVEALEDSRQPATAIELGINAGYAMAELSTGKELDWERQRELAIDVWSALVKLQNLASSMARTVRIEATSGLVNQAKQEGKLSEDVNMFQASDMGIYKIAAQIRDNYVRESDHLKQVQDTMLPLARILLDSPSPILTQIPISMFGSEFDLMGYGLGLYGVDSELMLKMLGTWKAFFENQIPNMSRYFEEKGQEPEQAKADGRYSDLESKPDSKWRYQYSLQGDKKALTCYKWSETVFLELNSEHLWGMRFIGVPGAVGNCAFEALKDVLSLANAEAASCGPAYVQAEIEQELRYIDNPDEWPEQYIQQVKEEKQSEAGRLVHGISDLILSGLPRKLPEEDLPLKYDPALHLDRTLSLLEETLPQAETSPGLVVAARMAAKELAIELGSWSHIEVLDTEPSLAKRCKELFEQAKVSLPDDWCTRLRARGILPKAESQT